MAVAIRTRYLGPTNHRGSRVVAEVCETFDGKRDRVTIGWNPALDPERNHAVAARALLAKFQARAEHDDTIWNQPHRWHRGATDDGWVWVYVGANDLDTLTPQPI
jgi:hypothetical protein